MATFNNEAELLADLTSIFGAGCIDTSLCYFPHDGRYNMWNGKNWTPNPDVPLILKAITIMDLNTDVNVQAAQDREIQYFIQKNTNKCVYRGYAKPKKEVPA